MVRRSCPLLVYMPRVACCPLRTACPPVAISSLSMREPRISHSSGRAVQGQPAAVGMPSAIAQRPHAAGRQYKAANGAKSLFLHTLT